MVSRHFMSRRRFLVGSAAAGALVLTPSFLAVTPAGATSTDVRVINASGVRLRSGAGTGYSVLASLSRGTHVRYLAPGGNANGHSWSKVQVVSTGRTGFVASQFLSPLPGGGNFAIGSMAHVDSASGRANLRSSASTSASVVAVLNNGLTGTVQEGPVQANGYTWYKLNFGDVQGWMATAVLAPGGGSDRSTVRVSSGPLNVRSQPGLSGSILGTAPTGATGFVTTEMPRDANGYTWVNVQFNGGLRGWVVTNYLTWI